MYESLTLKYIEIGLLGRERHDSRARPSPRATSSRRPLSSVLLRKVPSIDNEATEG